MRSDGQKSKGSIDLRVRGTNKRQADLIARAHQNQNNARGVSGGVRNGEGRRVANLASVDEGVRRSLEGSGLFGSLCVCVCACALRMETTG